jgi:hypothetical protein
VLLLVKDVDRGKGWIKITKLHIGASTYLCGGVSIGAEINDQTIFCTQQKFVSRKFESKFFFLDLVPDPRTQMAEAVKWLQKLNELPEAEKNREIKSKLPSVVFTPLETKSRM